MISREICVFSPLSVVFQFAGYLPFCPCSSEEVLGTHAARNIEEGGSTAQLSEPFTVGKTELFLLSLKNAHCPSYAYTTEKCPPIRAGTEHVFSPAIFGVGT